MIYPIKKNLKKITYKIKNKKFIARKKKCEVCDSDKSLLFHNCGKIGNHPGKYGYLPIRICKICSLKFISPTPTNNFYKKFFKLDYGASYFRGKYRPNKDHSKFQLIRGKLVYDYFKKFIKIKSKILDHGCSTGLTMMEWRKNGYDINGVDPHKPAVYYGIKKYNLNYNKLIKRIALFNFLSINIILFYFLYEFSNLSDMNRLIIGLIIFVSIFGFTSLMDGYKWSKNFEIFRSIFITTILMFDFNSFYNYHNTFTTFIILYSIFNILLISPNKSYLPKRKN